MIRIDRRRVPSPLNPGLVERAQVRLREFYSQPEGVRQKQKLDAGERISISREARGSLLDLFHNKCAYCESELGAVASGEVDLFRPFTDASDLSGKGSPDHYGWLSADWENLYIACPACARAKRSLFPVEGGRAEVLSTLEVVRQTETPLLLDPCFDDAELHLKFEETGTVDALSPAGETTIKVLNLNRVGLVKARESVWRLTTMSLEAGLSRVEAEAMLRDQRPHAAVVRAAAAATRRKARADEPQPLREAVARVVPRETRSADRILADDAEAFRLTARPLKRVVVRNFRALRNVSLDFGEPGSERAPWLMLLGENATGKSTVLQAIALALAGTEEASRHARPAGMLSVGTFEGCVMVWFWDQEAPVELHFRRGEQGLRGTPSASAIVLAYGALRYAERRTRAFDPGPRFSRIAPIMEPIARVPYPGRWLLGLNPTRFDTAARAMRSILPVGPDSVMLRSGNSVFFDVGGHRATLAQLSAGYQTIVGMCADIMRQLFERWDTLASAQGIVLIDEIDAHLHPRWTMRIVGALREAFPQVQFVASTHDPLALRGLRNGEVALLRRDADGAVVADQDLPPLEGMPVEQLLTSRVFGLASTIDPSTEALLDEYYHLRSLPPDPTRNDRMERIRGRVADLEALGRSESEQLMLQATTEFVQAATAEAAAAPPLREETLKALREIADRGATRRRRS